MEEILVVRASIRQKSKISFLMIFFELLDNNPRAGGAKLSPIQFELVFIVTIQQDVV